MDEQTRVTVSVLAALATGGGEATNVDAALLNMVSGIGIGSGSAATGVVYAKRVQQRWKGRRALHSLTC